MQTLESYALELGENARRAARELAGMSDGDRSAALRRIATALREGRPLLLEANAADVRAAQEAGLAGPMVERLKLDEKRIGAMADAVEQIAAQVDPVGRVIEGYNRPNGLRIEKVRVPIGVVLFIYESRPNVTSDAAALCLKSGNAVILRGGKEAMNSNKAVVGLIHSALSAQHSALANAVQLVESADRALLPHLLKLDQHIDLVIPRGGEGLIRAVVKDSTIPVIKHYTGNCHVYVDEQCDGEMARQIVLNAKTQRPSVCNAAETLLVHRAHAAAGGLLSQMLADLQKAGVEIRGDERVLKNAPNAKATTEQDWFTEYLDLVLAVRVVDSLDQAIDHINHYGSHHTDAIVTTSLASAERFARAVDSASVMVNVSTRFSDGGEYGLGAEIGISTDKLHARGPMGAADLTTYKWIVRGDGQVR